MSAELEEAVARAIQVSVDNWTPYGRLSVAQTAARAALAVVREKMGEPVAQAIVDDLFQDLRGRSFLKWLFSKFPTVIGNLEGKALTSLDDDVQQEIQQEWKAIIKARLYASHLGEDKP
jgi:hypothetical protein